MNRATKTIPVKSILVKSIRAKTIGVKTIATLSLLSLAVINSSTAMANDSFWYGGANIGQSTATIDNAKIRAQLQAGGLTTSSLSNDDSDLSYKIFGGYQVNKNFAVEAGYFNLGKFGYTATTVPAGSLTGKIKLQGLNIDAVGMLPFAEKFSAFGRIGAQYAQARDTFTGTGAVIVTDPNSGKSSINYKAGVGLQYDFNRSLGMRAEIERHRINDAIGSTGDFNTYSMGLVYRFGQHATPARKVSRSVANAAAAPIRVIVPLAVKTQKYCSILDIEFEVKQDEIQREEKEKLAVVGTFMKKYPNTTALIEGHSDNVGTSEFNLKLSQKRADSVVSYLVNELKIASSRLSAVGYGETRPVADNDTQEGRQANRRINAVIACATDIADLKVLPARITMAMEMEFDPFKAEVEPEYREDLRHVANFMKANPSVTATVEGHDGKSVGVGSEKMIIAPELAMAISQRRAQSVVNYLVDHFGVARARLTAEAFGQTRLVAYSTTLEGQQENRRVNIIFNYKAR